ncbi:MAG: dTDP-4-dehydrorhamnose reductase [Alphaproteobacteria bacterium]|nr:dTDP-4-dehydrorhamnose reductase [Alphaproteobacteria bacterium]
MKIFVAGAAGQVASSLVQRAALGGYDLTAAGRPELDLLDAASIDAAIAAHRPDVVVNAAAYTAVDQAENDADAARQLNATGAEALARAAASAGASIIHLSTDYVYDGSKRAPYVETDPTAPLCVYGHTKLEGERLVAAANPRAIILRTAWVFSPFGKNFVKTMLRLAASNDVVNVVDDQHGSPTYAPDLADAILGVAGRASAEGASGSAASGIFHAAGSGYATWADVAAETFAASAALGGPASRVNRISSADYPTPVTRPANSRLDGAKLGAVFGVQLRDWRAGVHDCVARLLQDAA